MKDLKKSDFFLYHFLMEFLILIFSLPFDAIREKTIAAMPMRRKATIFIADIVDATANAIITAATDRKQGIFLSIDADS